MKTAPSKTSTPPAAVEAFIDSERRRADVVGVSAAAFDREGIRFAGGYGYADLARGEPVTPDTLFRAASITKLFTTALVLQEVEAGRLDLDDPVNRHLDAPARLADEHGAPAGDVTVRHLLTHTSGLPVSWRGLEYGPLPYKLLLNGPSVPKTLEELVAGMRTVRRPGRRFVYANGGFALLGYVVQRLAGAPYEELVRERVFDPLEMTASGLPVAPRGPGIATPYGGLMGGAGRRPAPFVRNRAGPAGALVTSALELSRFGQMVLRDGEWGGRRLLSPDALRDATRFHWRNHPDLDDGWGLGFHVSTYRGRRLTGHSGGLSGVSTLVQLAPDDGVGSVVLTNGASPALVARISERLLDSLLGLEPEQLPGSPRGMQPGSEPEWTDLGRRAAGRYRLRDMAPPGPLTWLLGLNARPRLSPLPQGVLAMDAPGLEPAFLYPDGDLGRYRIASGMASGRRAVVDERSGGTYVWASFLRLFRPRR